jgi:hypothetical protein
MRTPKPLLLIAMLLLPGCALLNPPAPISASCPPPPQAPQAVTGYVSPAKNLIEDSGQLLLDFRNELSQTLKKASGESM